MVENQTRRYTRSTYKAWGSNVLNYVLVSEYHSNKIRLSDEEALRVVFSPRLCPL